MGQVSGFSIPNIDATVLPPDTDDAIDGGPFNRSLFDEPPTPRDDISLDEREPFPLIGNRDPPPIPLLLVRVNDAAPPPPPPPPPPPDDEAPVRAEPPLRPVPGAPILPTWDEER
jgi:hypothetical protein